MSASSLTEGALAQALRIDQIPSHTLLAGRYEVESKLGDGGVASVYLARDRRLGRPVALKLLDPLRGADPVGRARFVRELEALSRLEGRGVARAFGREVEGDLEMLVLEYIEGESLEARLLRGPFSVEEAVSVASALLEALEACHAKDILHRDLKPANIVLHPERGPVILDFGMAWFSAASNLTRTGALIGTPRYLPPEAFRSSSYDARGDLYAVSVILFEMLAGRTPYLSDTVSELVSAHRRGPPPLVSVLRPEAPLRLAQVLARALDVRPEARFATAFELRQALLGHADAPARRFEERLTCPSCSGPLMIDLPFCPSCGTKVSWGLEPGPYAVQLDAVEDAERAARFFYRKYRKDLRLYPRALVSRLALTPVPLVVDVSRMAAEELASEARAVGCEPRILRARTLVGAKLETREATLEEVMSVAALHFAATFVLGSLFMALAETHYTSFLAPPLTGLLGVGLAWLWNRRPVLRPSKKELRSDPVEEGLRARLRRLRTPRGKEMARFVLARAAPLLLGDVKDLAAGAKEDAEDALARALDAADRLDRHQAVLLSRSRSELCHELEELAFRLEASGQPEVADRLKALEDERQSLTEAALAHDHAAREVLEAAAELSQALRARADPRHAGGLVLGPS